MAQPKYASGDLSFKADPSKINANGSVDYKSLFAQPANNGYEFASNINTDVNAGGGAMDWLGKNKDGFAVGGAILQGAGSLWSAWNGFQQNKQAEKQFAFEKQAYNTNLANQAQTINTQLEDRQRARIGGTGDGNASGNYESLNTYMANNKVDGTALA